MRILILGGNGMIGHKIYQELKEEFEDVWVLIRKPLESLKYKNIYDSKIIDNFDLIDIDLLKKKIEILNPQIIINAAGITIRRGINELTSKSILINSVLPNILNEWANSKLNKKVIHFSTDCVFSGKTGPYNENSFNDANDLYGKSKSLGEISGKNSLTLRSSMIGPELDNFTELFEWVLSQNNKKIKGFTNVLYSGITTIRMSNYIIDIIKNHLDFNGLYNISSIPISKFDLIQLISKNFNLNIEIESDKSYSSNKVLDSTLFFDKTKQQMPNWDDLIVEMKKDYLINYTIYKKYNYEH